MIKDKTLLTEYFTHAHIYIYIDICIDIFTSSNAYAMLFRCCELFFQIASYVKGFIKMLFVLSTGETLKELKSI